MLYANGSIGGIINVVDDCIAQMDFAGSEFSAGYEKQSVNDGTAQNFNFKYISRKYIEEYNYILCTFLL